MRLVIDQFMGWLDVDHVCQTLNSGSKRCEVTMLRIDRLYTTVPPHLSCVPENFRRDAKEQGIVLPSTTTDADILEVWDYGSRASWSDDEILGALKAGAVAFGWDGPYCSAVDKDGKVIENW